MSAVGRCPFRSLPRANVLTRRPAPGGPPATYGHSQMKSPTAVVAAPPRWANARHCHRVHMACAPHAAKVWTSCVELAVEPSPAALARAFSFHALTMPRAASTTAKDLAALPQPRILALASSAEQAPAVSGARIPITSDGTWACWRRGRRWWRARRRRRRRRRGRWWRRRRRRAGWQWEG